MGSLCSKSSTHSGGHTVLGSDTQPRISSRPVQHRNASRPSQSRGTRPAQPGGASRLGTSNTTSDPRAAAAAAAEQRLQAAKARGTNNTNPNKGRLASQLEASRSAVHAPEPRQEEQLVVC
ncbi:hypothetical protein OF83DRAFT_1066871 [Amylostereum chailletii]|nr:hypothetical protein OF83DRAFT_1066871 [Amylostereum chailletii]